MIPKEKNTKKPKVMVILATYNGIEWLEQQVESILKQLDVQIEIVVSDDSSSDGTLNYLVEKSRSSSINILASNYQGSAGQNFLKLIRETNFKGIDYVAISDQDDIWKKNKIISAIKRVKFLSVDGYSGNVTAFWENGKQKLLNKAQPQQTLDYMFESSGPGCSFVLSKKLAMELQQFLLLNQAKCKDVALHDWFIYAFARSRGYKWTIDKESYISYRQHGKNVVGANIGIQAKKERWKKMREGWHRTQALLIANILGYGNDFPMVELERYSFFDRLTLMISFRSLRRRLRDALVLALYFMITPKK